MQVYSAIMFDEEDAADHNCPTVLLAGSEAILCSKVQDFVKNHSNWLDTLGVNRAEVDTMTVDEINELLCENANELFIHTGCEEV